MRVGRTRQKLADILMRDIDFIADADPSDLRRSFNTSRYSDECRWEGYVKNSFGVKVYIQSFSTMGDCLRYGVCHIGDMQIEANC